MKNQANYYAIIPASVRYDKNLNSTEKLLYAEITALCDKEGYCWATNKYFSEIIGVTDVYVSQVLSKLSKKGYIKIEIERNEKGTYRKIYIGEVKEKTIKGVVKQVESKEEVGGTEKTVEGYRKNDSGGIEKTIGGYRKNYSHNNNIINNTENNKEKNNNINIIIPKEKKFIKPNFEEIKKYCEERKNKIKAQDFLDYYDSVGWKIGNKPMKDWQACIRTWEHKEQNKASPNNFKFGMDNWNDLTLEEKAKANWTRLSAVEKAEYMRLQDEKEGSPDG